MYILDVIPLQKGIPRDTLSYFSVRDIPLGALVEIPLQSKTISGIVIKSAPARDMKASIRSGSFSLKSIKSVINEKGFPVKILQSLQSLSLQTLIPIGTLITTFFPDTVFSFFQTWKPITMTKTDLRIIELPTTERYDYYRLLIREAFAKQHSIQFITPTNIENKALTDFLKTSIESSRVVSISGTHTPLQREKIYNELAKTEQPIVICTTPQFFMVPYVVIGSCIIDASESPYYVQDFSWNIDYRLIIMKMTEVLGYTRYLSDSIPSPEYIKMIKDRKAFQERTSKKKMSRENDISIIKKESLNDVHYVSPLLSSETLEIIAQYLKKSEPIFIFSARKGIATTTTCRDCGFTVTCPNCKGVMQLIKKNPLIESDRVFSCGRCNTESPAINHCPVCLGWNLIPLGITTEALTEELKKFFPGIPLLQASADTIKTEAACKKNISNWKTSNGILVGTQKILPYLPKTPLVIMASFEHCMSIPNFKTPITTLWIMQQLYEKTEGKFIIQTKEQENELLTSFKQYDFENMFQYDMQLRKELLYPPYATLITIVMEQISRKDHVRAKEYLKKNISSFEHSIQSQFFEYSQTYTITATIHIPIDIWNDPSHREKNECMAFLTSIRSYTDISIESPLI